MRDAILIGLSVIVGFVAAFALIILLNYLGVF